MEIVLERILVEVFAVVAQLALLRLLAWLRGRATGGAPVAGTVELATAH